MTETQPTQRMPIPYVAIGLALLVIVLGWYFATPSQPATPPTPAGPTVGASNTPNWPLTVQEGVLQCSGSAVTIQTPEGTIYALNGNARNQAQERGWKDGGDVQVGDVGPLIRQGLALCS